MSPKELRTFRTSLQLSQVQFAQVFGLSWPTIGRWERASHSIGPYHEALFGKIESSGRKTLTAEILNRFGPIEALYYLLGAPYKSSIERGHG
jgi:transcriptional regulator with XRE-family HTH domain